jgi:hypothetical protein
MYRAITNRMLSGGSLCRILLAAVLLLVFPLLAHANDVAVVVGVADYADRTIPDLQFADDDARLFAKTLTR